ncbi:MAG: hypothetical protein ABIK37_06295 [candidate division WOR-3 bacterium]
MDSIQDTGQGGAAELAALVMLDGSAAAETGKAGWPPTRKSLLRFVERIGRRFLERPLKRTGKRLAKRI